MKKEAKIEDMMNSKNTFRITILLCCCLACTFLLPDTASAVDTDFAKKIVNTFYNKASSWEPILRKYAIIVFQWLLILEVCFLGIKAALNRDQVGDILKQFVMLLLMAGFFLAVINHYAEWTDNLIHGLKGIGVDISGGYHADTPFVTGVKLVAKILDKLSVWSPGNSVALLIAALVIMICFALISAQIIFIQCEAMVAMMAALILVGFGGSSFLKDYAINALRYALSVAFKLFVMQLVLGIGIAFIEDFSTGTATLQDIFVTIGASIVLLALVKSLPDVVAGIISGSHVSSGGALTSAAASVAGGAMVAGAMAMGGAHMMGNVKDAANIASMEGKTGLGKAASMFRTMQSARNDAKTPGEKSQGSRTRSEMRSRLEEAKQAHMAKKD